MICEKIAAVTNCIHILKKSKQPSASQKTCLTMKLTEFEAL